MEFSAIRVRKQPIVSTWTRDCDGQDSSYWHTTCTASDEKPATCYKGTRSRTRVCHSDSFGACTTCPNIDPATHPDDYAEDHPKCAHLDLVLQGTNEVQHTDPTAGGPSAGGLAECGM